MTSITETDRPYPGMIWAVTSVDGVPGGRSYAGATVNRASTGSADFAPLSTVKVTIESAGEDPNGAKPACMGYYTLDPPQKYYDPHLPAVGSIAEKMPSAVIVTAEVRPGYKFVGWKGDGQAVAPIAGNFPSRDTVWKNQATCLKDVSDITSNSIMILTDKSRELVALFEFPQVVSFSFAGSDGLEGSCSDHAFDGCLYNTYTWDSSTGNLDDLQGGILEILAHDDNVSVEEIINAIKNKGYAQLCATSKVRLSEFPSGTNVEDIIEQPWASIFLEMPARFFKWAICDAKRNNFTDNNGFGPYFCLFSCKNGKYTTKQYFFYMTECNYVQFLAGPYDIVRESCKDSRSLGICKHGYEYYTWCQQWPMTCPCGI